MDYQALGQFAGYVIVVIGAHWVTRGDLKSTLRDLKNSIAGLTEQLAVMHNDVSAHERRITSLEGRLDMLGYVRNTLPDHVAVTVETPASVEGMNSGR